MIDELTPFNRLLITGTRITAHNSTLDQTRFDELNGSICDSIDVDEVVACCRFQSFIGWNERTKEGGSAQMIIIGQSEQEEEKERDMVILKPPKDIPMKHFIQTETQVSKKKKKKFPFSQRRA